MRVAVWPVDNAGVGNYRLRFPAVTLAAQGADVVVDQTGPQVAWDRHWQGGVPPIDARILGVETVDAEVVVMQRPTVLYRLDAIRHLQAAGIKVVVDVDDRLDRVHKAHAARASFHQPTANHEILDACCMTADLVTCSTPALRDRYGHGHGVVLPNLIPSRYLNLWPLKRVQTVGWSGFVGIHPGDLQVTAGAVQQAIDTVRPTVAGLAGVPWSFHVIGEARGVRTALRLTHDPTETGVVPFDLYPQSLAELEVGVVPLELSEFNAAKSCLKAMEMASVEVPVVMSPTPDNLRLHRLGVGLIAESRGQWARHLTRLMANPTERAELAGSAKQAVTLLTYEAHCGRWWDAWQSTLQHHKPREAVTV